MQLPKVAITGGSGRLGRYVVDYFRDKADVTVVDIRPPEQADVRFVEANILDGAALATAFSGQEAVVHLAAIPNPRIAPAAVTFQTNVQGSWNVLDTAEKAGVRRVVATSSDAVTGLHYNEENLCPAYLPIDEAHALRPVEFYALSKQVNEVVCRSYANRGKLEVLVIRPVHIVFPSEWPELQTRGDDVQNYHLWGYVEPQDVAQAFYRAVTVADVRFDIFFIAAADSLCSRPTLDMVQERFGKLPEIRKPEVFERNPHATILDISRARSVLGFEPTNNWRRLLPGTQATCTA